MSKRCPHALARHCPLYVASHGTGHGCDDGHLGNGLCAVARGLRYGAAVEALRVAVPGLVERLAFFEEAEAARLQRARNLRLNGIH